MTLRRRLAITLSGLIIGLVLIAGTAIVGLVGIRADMTALLSEHRELRLVDQISISISEVLGELRDDLIDPQFLLEKLDQAKEAAAKFVEHQGSEFHADVGHGDREAAMIHSIVSTIEDLRQSAPELFSDGASVTRLEVRAKADALLQSLNSLADETLEAVKVARRDASNTTRWTLIVTLGVAAAVIVGAILIGASQYRAVVGQLDRLRHGVLGLTGKEFKQSLPTDGDLEFATLAGEFNQMSAQLRSLYETLETQVRQKTRELVRSERLASVGFLAAGVAHEINNPLSIISTYAELSLRDLQTLDDSPAIEQVRQSLLIMHEEAYRCKGIIEKLISLSRGDDGVRTVVPLSQVVQEVAMLVGKLPKYRDRELKVDAASLVDLIVFASDAQVRQVLLNLTANALEAVAPITGCVAITGRRVDHVAQLTIRDNGVGMDKATLDHIFEPFFTTKRSNSGPGLGLGLSICHAIVTGHGGRIWAESEGPGKGSRFIVELPLYSGKETTQQSSRPEEVNHV